MSTPFVIYYGDGSTYIGPPEGAPARDVQCIAVPDPSDKMKNVGRFVYHAWDFYIYSDRVGGWHVTNHVHDLIDHLSQGCGLGGVRAVLTGRWIDSAVFKEIHHRAMTDGELPRRQGNPNPIEVVEDGRV